MAGGDRDGADLRRRHQERALSGARLEEGAETLRELREGEAEGEGAPH